MFTARRSHYIPRRADACRSCECAFVQCRWGVVQRTNVSWTRSGWRKPAVVRERTGPVKNAHYRKCVTVPRRANARRSCECAFVQCRWGVVQRTNVSWTRSGWRKPAVVRERTGPVKNAHYCKCDTEPRRADARRSWRRLFPGGIAWPPVRRWLVRERRYSVQPTARARCLLRTATFRTEEREDPSRW
jgi:hypothetical protein